MADQQGSPTWCRTMVDSTAHVVAQACMKGPGARSWEEVSGVYHMTAQGSTSWHGFTEAILAHPSVEPRPAVTPFATSDYPLPALRPANSVLDCTRFMDTFCVIPQWDVALRLCQG